MNPISLIALALAMLAFAATPGPGVFATVATSLSSGFRSALAFIAGIVAGDILYLLLAIFGLSAAAQALGKMFVLIKVLGGIYLVWLGVKLWLAKSRQAGESQKRRTRSRCENFAGGFLLTLSNPKVVLFYCGFLPTFLDLSSISPVNIGVVGVVIALVVSSVLMIYALLADSCRSVLFNEKSDGYLNRAAGGVMMATGVSVALHS